MQYTSKIALLAVALFGTSALAALYAGDVEYDIEAREVDNDLAAREFYNVYMEARSNPSLNARDLEYMDFEAREYLDYLEAREVAAAVCLIVLKCSLLCDSTNFCYLQQAAEVHAAEPGRRRNPAPIPSETFTRVSRRGQGARFCWFWIRARAAVFDQTPET